MRTVVACSILLNQASYLCKILRDLRLLLIYTCLIVAMTTTAAEVYVFDNAKHAYQPPEGR